jgi:hypothetical protein
MTRTEFEEQRATLICRHCGGVGLEQFSPGPSDALVGARCPWCLRNHPIDGIQWLPKDSAGARRPRVGKVTTDEVWEANGNRCAFCAKPRALLDRLHIQATVQHVVPVVYGGGEGPLIPFCSRCQQASAAALEETRLVLGEIDSLDGIIKRIEEKHPELRL